ncbi:hypothetical protein PSHT_03022 [Puccinia striiformis]|uniref:Uncharacterized protein n=2 Tax=Puccinia striiformis TaxID=27350 RepID=A0A0L0V253_9BASI|nr:hypothetical protein PSTG_13542 [Puccinia striiformis f. sp. tritici PST-78]POW20946.1 hypothetical protein PSHT_03022 [Puccinia striiformis]
MVLYEYIRICDFLSRKMAAAASTVLEPMFNPMIRVTQKYLDLALKQGCNRYATCIVSANTCIAPADAQFSQAVHRSEHPIQCRYSIGLHRWYWQKTGVFSFWA